MTCVKPFFFACFGTICGTICYRDGKFVLLSKADGKVLVEIEMSKELFMAANNVRIIVYDLMQYALSNPGTEMVSCFNACSYYFF